jgi:hypothetical protein
MLIVSSVAKQITSPHSSITLSRLVATAGRQASAEHACYIGNGAGRGNNRDDRLIIDQSAGSTLNPPANLVDPLLDGRFRDGIDPDDFAYSKGLKVNGILEATDYLVLKSPDGYTLGRHGG